MSNKKIWFITGASRGMGVDFAKATLAAGHAVVASGRDRDRVSIASQVPPPRRSIAGADAIATAQQKLADLKAQIDAERTVV